MQTLKTEMNFEDGDAFYEKLMDAQRDLSDEAAALFNCRLVLLLANHIRDAAVLVQAIDCAREIKP